MPILRDYQPQDFTRLLEIDQACFREGIAYSGEELHYFLNMATAITLVAVAAVEIAGANDLNHHGATLGFIVADCFRQRRATRLMGRVITIDVDPRTQHRGVGTLLLTGAEQRLRDAACEYISLETAVDNYPALRFYKKHGYSVLRVLPRYYLDSIDGLLMGKKL